MAAEGGPRGARGPRPARAARATRGPRSRRRLDLQRLQSPGLEPQARARATLRTCRGAEQPQHFFRCSWCAGSRCLGVGMFAAIFLTPRVVEGVSQYPNWRHTWVLSMPAEAPHALQSDRVAAGATLDLCR
ncbi:hypothetical protein ACRRTK_008743 [Alexandromys fortis]